MKNLTNPSLFKTQCYINGEWVDADNSETMDVTNPFDQAVLATVPNCGQAEAQRAIDAANAAWPLWRSKTAKERCDILHRWADLIDQHKKDLARILTLEQGKSLKEAQGEIDYGNAFIKWFAEEARRVYGDIIPSNKVNQRILVLKQPIGVCAAITPWNFPNAMITRKIAPAIAVGCTVVIKPAEDTPLSAFALAVLAEEAGFPKGVINILTGDAKAIGKELTTNPIVRKVSFTGSTEVGRILMQQSASTIKKLSLELGGNAPFIVFDDADLEAATEGALISKFRNSGQTCVCANRIYVQKGIYDDFANALAKKMHSLQLGSGLEESTSQGPLINSAALDKIESHIEDAVSKGANLQLGGKRSQLGGLFFEPTLLTHVTQAMKIAKEETFGPVAPLFQFDSEDEVVQMANDTEFGLAAYFYTQNCQRQFRVAESLEYGMVGVNTGLLSTEVAPFGGIKSSGVGREGSKYGIDDYLEMKYVCLE